MLWQQPSLLLLGNVDELVVAAAAAAAAVVAVIPQTNPTLQNMNISNFVC